MFTRAMRSSMVKWNFSAIQTNAAHHWVGQEYVAFFDEVNKRTNGKFEIVFHSGSSLYKGTEILRVLKDDLIQSAEISVFVEGDEPIMGWSFLPFLMTQDIAWRVSDQVQPYYVEPILQDKWNIKVLSTWYAYSVSIPSTKSIKTLGDLKGLSIRVNSAEVGKLVQRLGATPVYTTSSEVIPGLQTGVFDATLSGGGGLERGIADLTPYVVRLDIMPSVWMFGVNMSEFKKLPQEWQDMLVEMGKKYQSRAPALEKAHSDSTWERLTKKVSITQFTEKEIATLRTMSIEIQDDWGAKSDLASKVLKAARAAVEKFQSEK